MVRWIHCQKGVMRQPSFVATGVRVQPATMCGQPSQMPVLRMARMIRQYCGRQGPDRMALPATALRGVQTISPGVQKIRNRQTELHCQAAIHPRDQVLRLTRYMKTTIRRSSGGAMSHTARRPASRKERTQKQTHQNRKSRTEGHIRQLTGAPLRRVRKARLP